MFACGVSVAALVAASNWWLAGAVADFDFVRDRYFGPPITVSRASSAYIDDSAGNWTLVPPNTARRSDKGLLVEGAQTNSIRNNSMQGAVAGTPGTLPTNWSFIANSGLTTQIVGTGVQNGIDYVDIRASGTSTGTFFVLAFDSSQTASPGQLWTNSVFAARLGSFTGPSNVVTQVRQTGGSGGNADAAMSLSTTLVRQPSSSNTLTTNATAVVPAITVYFPAAGTAVDFTIRIGWPQLEQWNTSVTTVGGASSPIRTTGTAATRAADVVTATLANGVGPATIAGVFNPQIDVINGGILQLSNGTDYVRLRRGTNFSTISNMSGDLSSGGTGQASATAPNGIAPAGVRHGFAFASAVNDSGLSIDGSTPATAAPAAYPAGLNALAFGTQPRNMFGYIERLAVLPYRASNDNLQTLSSLGTYGG